MSTDLSTIDGVISSLYSAISFEKGGEPNYELFKSLFHKSATIFQPIEDTDGVLKPVNVDDFVNSFSRTIEQEGILETGATEVEIERKTISFRRIANVFSSYEFTLNGAKTPLARGINTFQLVNDASRWWIVSLTWDRAKPGESLTMETEK